MTQTGMQIRPIRTASDHRAAIARIEKLMSAGPDTAEGEELDVLATLVDAYEAKHFPVNAPDPIAALEFRMEQQGLSRKDLEPMIGSRARVSEVLSGKRSLTLKMVRRLRTGLGISADLLIGPGWQVGKAVRKARPSSKAESKKAETAGLNGRKALGTVC